MSADPERCEDGPVTIVEFFTARLDEREAVARAAYLAPAEPGSPDYEAYGPGTGWFVMDDLTSEERMDGVAASFVVAMSPAYVLADIAAKRAIIDEYSAAVDQAERSRRHVGDFDAVRAALMVSDRLGLVLRYLIQPFAEHPDFDPAWLV